MTAWKSIVAVILAASAGLWLAGCKSETTGPAGSGEQRKIGFSQVGAESDWRTAETKSIRAEAGTRKVKLVFSDAQGKVEQQRQALRTFVTQQVDAIILAPKVKKGWDPVLKEVKAAGIPVILVDRGIETGDESLYETLIASDFVEEGRMAARWLVKKAGGKAKIVQLEGTSGSDPANDRKKGFEEIINQQDGMTIIASQTGDFKQGQGKEVMEAMLKTHGKAITAVYAHNDNMALGAIQAIEDAGLKPGTDILLVSIDGVRGAFEAMVAGKLNCTVECSPLLGPAAFDAVEQVLAGKKLPKRITVKDQVFDQSVAKDVIGSRQY